MTRLVATPYAHPSQVPINGSHWQIATDEDFTNLVFDQRVAQAADSIVISTDPLDQPWLSVNTKYYWRMRYFDVRDNDSKWSEPLSFTTYVATTVASILQPTFITPVNQGTIPYAGLFVKLSPPQTIGNVNVDSADLQVSLTPNFNPSDILLDISDNASPIFFTAETDLRTAPNRLYMRARQKDTVTGLTSAWTATQVVFVQRAFGDSVIGVAIHISGTQSFVTHIDRYGTPIPIPADYFDNHPIWGGMVTDIMQIHNAGTLAGLSQNVRIPKFYCTAKTIEHPESIEHRIWLSPFKVDDNWYPHPAFITNPNGFLYSFRFLGQLLQTHTASHADLTNLTVSAASLNQNNIAAWITQRNNARAVVGPGMNLTNIHTENAVRLLRLVERGQIDDNLIINAPLYRGIDVSGGGGINSLRVLGLDLVGGAQSPDGIRLRLSSPVNPEEPTFIEYPIINPPSGGFVANILKMAHGYDENLMAHRELYCIPSEFEARSGIHPPLWVSVSAPAALSTQPNGALYRISNNVGLQSRGIMPTIERDTGGTGTMRSVFRL